ncbi:hypothetical protein H8356DRAFT_1682049 [Neocallimastix lanati (nom. inval.)]|nr:hypothetical protein H8356DRAFT_1682049 [Neocallimastix sp. JGI-2020a]
MTMKSNKLLLITFLYSINFLAKNTYAIDGYLTIYGDCNTVPGSEPESKTFCNTIYNSDFCQNYYNNPEQVVGEDFDESDLATINYHKEKGKAICQYDENNKLCPMGQYFIDISTNSNAKESDYMQQSCSSTLCSNTANSYLIAKEKYYSLKYQNKMTSFSKKIEEEKKALQCNNAQSTTSPSSKTIGNSKSNASSDPSNNNTSKPKSNSSSSSSSSSSSDSTTNTNNNADVNTNNNVQEDETLANNDNNGNINETLIIDESNFGVKLIFDERLIFLISFILINILFF